MCGPGGSQESFYLENGGLAIDGMMFEGAWSVNSGPAFAEFADRIATFYADDPNWSTGVVGHCRILGRDGDAPGRYRRDRNP